MKREGWKEKKKNVWTKGGVWAQKDLFEFLHAFVSALVHSWEELLRMVSGVCVSVSIFV